MQYMSLIIVEVLIYLLFLVGAKAFGSETAPEHVRVSNLDKMILMENEYYTVSPNARADTGYYDFEITTTKDSNIIRVSGILNLYKTLHEITAIEDYLAMQQDNQLWTGVKNSVKGSGRGWKQIFTHPGDSAAGTGQAIGRAGRNLGRGIKSLFIHPKESSDGRVLAEMGDSITGEQARRIAYEMHVDIYSDNPYLQQSIKKMAFRRWLGRQLVIIPSSAGQGAPLLLMLGISLGNNDKDNLETKLMNLPSAELIKWLEEIMSEKTGIKIRKKAFRPFRKFMSNPHYTPRQKAYATRYLMDFADSQQILIASARLSEADNTTDAQYMFYQLLLLHAYHQQYNTSCRIATYSGGIIGRDADAGIILFLPCDYMDITDKTIQEFSALLNDTTHLQIWSTGKIMPRFRDWLNTQCKLELNTDILLHAEFRQALDQYISY